MAWTFFRSARRHKPAPIPTAPTHGSLREAQRRMAQWLGEFRHGDPFETASPCLTARMDEARDMLSRTGPAMLSSWLDARSSPSRLRGRRMGSLLWDELGYPSVTTKLCLECLRLRHPSITDCPCRAPRVAAIYRKLEPHGA